MIKAAYSDKSIVIDILSSSFDANKSVNFIVKQDYKRKDRIKKLMAYAFEMCFMFGEVYLSTDRKACALILFPESEKNNLKTVLLQVNLILTCIGINRIGVVLNREKLVRKHHVKEPIYYLWFLGVMPEAQKRGRGTAVLNHVIKNSEEQRRAIFLETSTVANISWYEKFNFEKIAQLNLGYELFVFKRGYKND